MYTGFRFIKPCSLLGPYVRYHWILHCGTGISQLTFPIGCMQLIFHRGTPLYVSTTGNFQNRVTVSGQTAYPSYLSSTGAVRMIVTVLKPHAAGCIFRLPGNLLYNREIAADELGDAGLHELSDRVLDAESDDAGIGLIEQWLCQRIIDSPPDLNTRRICASVREINSNPFISLSELADAANLSGKQFTRIFSAILGMNPKEFYRIVRFQRALHLMEHTGGGRCVDSFSDMAYACGFSDQSHMIKEFKTFAGLTPGQLACAGPVYSDYFNQPV
jgi:AraC-like DNA-binding protein